MKKFSKKEISVMPLEQLEDRTFKMERALERRLHRAKKYQAMRDEIYIRLRENKEDGEDIDRLLNRLKYINRFMRHTARKIEFAEREYIKLTALMARNHGASHPAMFPVELPEKYIEACSNHGDLIYEPFLGSGSTLIACEKTGRRCFGMEIDPHYMSVIIKRYEDYTGDKAMRIE